MLVDTLKIINKIDIFIMIRTLIFTIGSVFLLAGLQSCKKYEEDRIYTIEFKEDRLSKSIGLDTLSVRYSAGYDGKGKVLFTSLDESKIEIVKSGPDYVIINKKVSSSSTAGIVASLLNDAKINSSDTLEFGNAAFKNKIIFQKKNGTNNDLFIIDPLNYVKINITNTPSLNEQFPTLSSDGTYFAYITKGNSLDTICIVNTDNNTTFRKTFSGTVSNLRFSGDGVYLSYLISGLPRAITVDGANMAFNYLGGTSGVTGAHITNYNGSIIPVTIYTQPSSYYGTEYFVTRGNKIVTSSTYYKYKAPCVSANGSSILCVYEYGGTSSIIEMDGNSGYSSSIVSSGFYDFTDLNQPDYAGDDVGVVFTAKPYGSSFSDLYIYDYKNYGYINITNTPNEDETNPNWN